MDDLKNTKQKSTAASQSAGPSKKIAAEDIDMYLPPSQRRKSKWPKALAIIILILVLLGILAFLYYRVYVATDSSTTQTSTQHLEHHQLKHYSSPDFNLDFSYPDNWKIHESSTKTKRLTLTSPTIILTGASGDNHQARMVLTVTSSGKAPKQLGKKPPVAVLDSTKIDYDKPSGQQDAQTYLSYLQYANTIIRGGLDAVYVTGGFGYQYGQTVPFSDIKQLNPIIRVTFDECDNKSCTSPSEYTISGKSWHNSRQQKSVQTILKSIRVS